MKELELEAYKQAVRDIKESLKAEGKTFIAFSVIKPSIYQQ